MPNRRDFLRGTFSVSVGLLAASQLSECFADIAEKTEPFKGRDIFERIYAKADSEKWTALPIGACMGKIATELKDTPYVGFTLELSKDSEICSVNLTGVDCVTFFEDTLDFARMLKKGGKTPDDLLAEVTFTRYRGGKLGDFTSRLHYTTDWLFDNQQKGVVRILAPELPGAEPFTQKVSVMSDAPNNYRQLVAHPDLTAKIKSCEDAINARTLQFIPKDKVAGVEALLRTGDVVGMCTDEKGTDIAHTGLIFQDEAGVPHFMDASSLKSKHKVTLETASISGSVNSSKKWTGAMFARPLEVKA